MRNWVIILLVFLVPISVFAVLQYTTKDYAANANSVQTEISDKGRFLKFSSPMCSECKQVKETVSVVIPDYKDTISFEDINVSDNSEKSEQLIETYKITVVPTVIFLDKNGKIVQKKEGVITEEELRENLDKIK